MSLIERDGPADVADVFLRTRRTLIAIDQQIGKGQRQLDELRLLRKRIKQQHMLAGADVRRARVGMVARIDGGD